MVTGTALTAESVVQLPVGEAYGLFGRPEAGSWLFDARCESMTVGTAVRCTLPVDHHAGCHGIELLGRLSAIRPNARIVIDHAQPWSGRLTLTFDSLGPRRARVRVRADVSPAGVEWLVRHGGIVFPTPPVSPNVVRIGVVTSKSGPGAVFSVATEYMAELAVNEVNASGGVAGRVLELLVADDATDPAVAAAEAHRLVRAGCRAIFVGTTSLSFAAINQAVGSEGVLLIHAVINERALSGATSAIQFGERPAAQIEASAGRLMRMSGGRNWFLVGQRYIWSYGAHLAARSAIPKATGRVIDEIYTPLGTTDFASTIERIERSGADIVLSSLVGADEVAFQQQCAAAGLPSTVSRLSLVLDESTCEYIGSAAAQGIWTALGYFQNGPGEGNPDLVSRYRAAYGRWAPPLSSVSETVYEAILQYAQAVHHNADASGRQQGQALLAHRAGTGGTAIGARDLLAPRLYLAEARAGQLSVFDEVG